MSGQINNKQVFSLLEVTKSIQKTLTDRYKSSFWVKAEMNKLNFYRHSGHCYPDLLEKQEGKVLAQIRSVLWKDDFTRINQKFLQVMNEPLKDGIKILFQARITYDSVYGLSLSILDIDPAFTLGDLEKEKQETIKRLHIEGVFNTNKNLKLPLLPQRIAIISVETSKGYADFLKVIENNTWGYKFFHFLFPSLLQGDKAINDISKQLDRIRKVISHFDAVAIIRGGGGDVGLSCFNSYELSRNIALFPIPVFTGIGHATNETVVEMVAYSNAITPTKLAENLLQKFHNFSVPVQEAEKTISDKSKRLLVEEKSKLATEIKLFRSISENILRNEKSNMQHCKWMIVKGINMFFANTHLEIKDLATTIHKDMRLQLSKFHLNIHQLNEKLIIQSKIKLKSSMLDVNSLEKNIANMNPVNVLKRGYSITFLNGKVVKSIGEIKKGDTINSTVFNGNIISIVNSTDKTIE